MPAKKKKADQLDDGKFTYTGPDGTEYELTLRQQRLANLTNKRPGFLARLFGGG